ncbi:hypothetical protein [Saccharococcus thermophilus]
MAESGNCGGRQRFSPTCAPAVGHGNDRKDGETITANTKKLYLQ